MAAKKAPAKKPAAKKPAAKKPATSKPAAAKTPATKAPAKEPPAAPAGSLAQVHATIEKLRAGGDMVRGLCPPARKAQPLDPSVLAALRLPDGAPLPASLVAWLSYDAREIDPVDEGGRLKTTTLREFMRGEMEEVAEELAEEDVDLDEMIENVLEGTPSVDAPALRLPDSASQAHFLVFDGSEEPPVLGYEKEEFWVKFASFGEFVAKWFRG